MSKVFKHAHQGGYQWTVPLPLIKELEFNSIALAGDKLFLGGSGKAGSKLWVLSSADGKKLSELTLSAQPAWDGFAAAGGRIYLTTREGGLICLAGR